MWFHPNRPGDSSKPPEFMLAMENKDLVIFWEAISRIQENALFLDPDTPEHIIFWDSLKAYLSINDPFADYLTRDEFSDTRQFQEEQYVGIGMEILKDTQGQVICFPYPGSPAEKMGIRAGDHLLNINGTPVSAKPLFTVASMVKGCKGPSINLIVKSLSETEKEVAVPCRQIQIRSVKKERLQNLTVIQILAFTKTTALTLENIFSHWKKRDPVVIDLRGNWGGDLQAAMDSAELFLEKGQIIASIVAREKSTTYESNTKALNLAYPLFLWQDAATASAAEVFIAALTENQKAVSIGRATFGKGTTQDIIELSDGSALILTTGQLKTPNGHVYQGHGLNPMYPLIKDSENTDAFLSKVNELMRRELKQSTN